MTAHLAPADRLPALETAVLWSMRHWVMCYRAGTSADARLARVMRDLGAAEASSYLSGLMWVVANAACRPLAVSCPCHRAVTADERTLLDVIALTQDRQHFERLLLLRTVLRPMASPSAGQSATGLVTACNRAGLFFRSTAPAIRQHGLPLATPLPH